MATQISRLSRHLALDVRRQGYAVTSITTLAFNYMIFSKDSFISAVALGAVTCKAGYYRHIVNGEGLLERWRSSLLRQFSY